MRKIIAVVFIGMIVFSLAGCAILKLQDPTPTPAQAFVAVSSSPAADTADASEPSGTESADPALTETPTPDLSDSPSEMPSYTETDLPTQTPSSTIIPTHTATPAPAPASQTISAGQTVTIPNVAEFSVSDTRFTGRGGHKAEKSYLDISIKYKNLQSSAVSALKAAAVQVQCDQNKYAASPTLEKAHGWTAYDIEPNGTCTIHFVAELPGQFTSVSAAITVGSTAYSIKIK